MWTDDEINTKRQLNFGFMLKENPNVNIDIDAMFDSKLDEEIASWFYGNKTDIVNQIFTEWQNNKPKTNRNNLWQNF
ncbi:hypothetical protein [Moraxella nonliquefaciens]|uniref:Uncharacterized protein n=1 Tax=Moraxella nonliquefaciens TaxID=478 RepID=A0A7T3EXV5_MORNO|nr:hypothetical protein [Moraxella nonliquefaciens]QPT43722.1 hypothetical protein I6G26_06390 [Moraxella nonliquefaciens]QQC30625.1 hypothetical protein I6H63_05185 [Moraxella nonliquefaciens]